MYHQWHRACNTGITYSLIWMIVMALFVAQPCQRHFFQNFDDLKFVSSKSSKVCFLFRNKSSLNLRELTCCH